MQTLVQPSISPKEVFLACIEGVDDLELHDKLFTIIEAIQREGEVYRMNAECGTLFKISKEITMANIVSITEMTDLYEKQMAYKKGIARSIYDRIKLAVIRCPFCAHQRVATLDHYLPKSKFPAHAVNPLNLIPCCRDCNTNKSTYAAETPDKQLLHPYFDDFSKDRWLQAHVIIGKPPVVTFAVIPPETWSTIDKSRIETHFRKFKLSELYASNAATELINIRYRLQCLFERGGPNEVRGHLLEEAKSRLCGSLNSWQAATYTALHESNWFCQEGCKL